MKLFKLPTLFGGTYGMRLFTVSKSVGLILPNVHGFYQTLWPSLQKLVKFNCKNSQLDNFEKESIFLVLDFICDSLKTSLYSSWNVDNEPEYIAVGDI